MLDVMKDLPAKNEKFSIKNLIDHWNWLVKFCKISEMEVRKRNAKKVFDIGIFRKIQLSEYCIFCKNLAMKMHFFQESCKKS